MSLRELLAIFPPDRCDVPFTAKRVDVARNEYELPTHQHAVGQLVLTLWGSTACRVFAAAVRGLDSAEYAALQPDNSAFQCVLALYPTGKCSTPLNMLHAGNHSASPRINPACRRISAGCHINRPCRAPYPGTSHGVVPNARNGSTATGVFRRTVAVCSGEHYWCVDSAERPFRLGQIYRHEPPFPSTACSQGDRIIFWTLATATSSGYSYPKIVRRRQRATDSMGSWLRIRYGLYYDVQKGAGNLTGEICHGRCRGKVA